MKIKIINKILFPAYIYLLVVSIYYYFAFNFAKFTLADIVRFLSVIIFDICPFILIFEIIRRKRKTFGKISYKKTILFSLIPGCIVGIFWGYGFFDMGHGEGFINLLTFWGLYLFVLFFSLVSGLLGVLIDFVWDKIELSHKK